MIGEIRDKETAETAIQASLTGHLVFSTLHTNDAPGAMTRLLDMGVEPFLVSSSIEGVLAQRLVRRVCPHCAVKYTPDAADLPPGFEPGEDGMLTRGQGCRECRRTGYRGRDGIYELIRRSDRPEVVVDKTVQLTHGRRLLGSNLAQPLVWDADWIGAFYGNEQTNWGTDLSPELLNDPQFGVRVAVRSRDGVARADIDELRLTVYYEVGYEHSSILSPGHSCTALAALRTAVEHYQP